MRQSNREIKDRAEIESIIEQARVCRVAFSENNIPYIVPMNFGYKDNCLYFHGATEGKKLDIIRKNNRVCFEIDTDEQVIKPDERPCTWTSKYRSIIGFGRAFIIADTRGKTDALNIITRHYGGGTYEFSEESLKKISIIKIQIESITGKKN